MTAWANTLKSAAHIQALEAALAVYDPSSEEAQRLRVHIANDQAIGDRKLRRLTSSYETSRVKLFRIMNARGRSRGVGVSVRLNGKQNVRLLLDTGASGISLSPGLAKKPACR